VSELFNIVGGDEGRSITDFTHRLEYDDLAGDARMVVRDLAGREREVRGKDGGWYLARLRPYRTVEDKLDGVVATFVDIGERHRTEDALRESESRMVLVGELQHRTRNLIGVVMALADRTAVGAPSLDAFRMSLGDRLMALARVQGLLSRAPSGDSVTFDELLASELSAQSAENDAGITLDGPRGVGLRFISVQALAMALHELATNAVKYGALGQRSGRLHVRWRVQAENGSPWILSTGGKVASRLLHLAISRRELAMAGD
jgi:two-component system, chemotaxis family, CheB/CheR fusion protein